MFSIKLHIKKKEWQINKNYSKYVYLCSTNLWKDLDACNHMKKC